MSSVGVDWAGGQWLGVSIENGSYADYHFGETFTRLWDTLEDPDCALIDIPIGLPEDAETLAARETVDSRVRSVTGKPSSVFPVPSRKAARMAFEGGSYEAVAEQNEADLAKGMNRQTFHISSGIGDVDSFLEDFETARDKIVESHPELCFRGLLGRELGYSKQSAAGIGERLTALEKLVDNPEGIVSSVTRELGGESKAVEMDDVIDAIGLGVLADRRGDELLFLPAGWERDRANLPMRMAYWAEEDLG